MTANKDKAVSQSPAFLGVKAARRQFKPTTLAVAIGSALTLLSGHGLVSAHAQTVTVSASQSTPATSSPTPGNDDGAVSRSILGTTDEDPRAEIEAFGRQVNVLGSGNVAISSNASTVAVEISAMTAAERTVTITDSPANTTPSPVTGPQSIVDIRSRSEAAIRSSSISNIGSILFAGNVSGNAAGIRLLSEAQEGNDDDGSALNIDTNASRSLDVSDTASNVATLNNVFTSVSLDFIANAIIENSNVASSGSIVVQGGANSNKFGIDIRASSEAESSFDLDLDAHARATANDTDASGAADAQSTAENSYSVLINGLGSQATSTVLNNGVSNSGAISVYGAGNLAGIRLRADTEADSDISIDSNANATSIATDNSSGDTVSGGPDAVAVSTANASVSLGITSFQASGVSRLEANDVFNSGSIQVVGTGNGISGVILRADSDIDLVLDFDNGVFTNSSATADASATATANSQINATISTVLASSVTRLRSNSLQNSGTINVSGSSNVAALRLESNSDVKIEFDFTDSVGGAADNTAVVTTINLASSADVTANDVINSGVLRASGQSLVSGILLHAQGRSLFELDGSVGGGDLNVDDLSIGVAASVQDNAVRNTGSLIVDGGAGTAAGIHLFAIANNPTESEDFGVSAVGSPTSGVAIRASNASAAIVGNTIENHGMIAVNGNTTANYVDGIRLHAEVGAATSNTTAVISSNTITNTGVIYAMDDGVELSATDGFNGDSVTNNTITNGYLARIVARDIGISINDGATASAAEAVKGNAVNNSGLIVSDNYGGGGAPGVAMSLDASVLTKSTRFAFNAVTAFTNVGTAIQIQGVAGADYSNTVNLNAPSYIAGQFLLDRNSNTEVTLSSGISHSTRWVFRDEFDILRGAKSFELTGPVPWFTDMDSLTTVNQAGVNDIQDDEDDIFATIDPSAFAAAPNQLSDLTGMASSLAAEGMNRAGVYRNGFWMSVRGSRMDYKGDNRATMDQDTRLQGGAFGFNRDFGGLRVGVMAGYADSKLEVGSFYPDLYKYSHENKADGGFAGVHVQGNLGAVKVGLGIMAGAMEHEDRRFVNDNLQWWGESYALASYDSRWYAPELTVSVPFEITDSLTFTPTLHGRYSVQKFDRYTETGSNSDATVYSHTIKMGEVRAGLELLKRYASGSTAGIQLGYLQRNLAGSDSVRVTMIGDTKSVPLFTRDLNAGYASIKFKLALSKAVSIQLDGTYVGGSEGSGGNVGAKLNLEF